LTNRNTNLKDLKPWSLVSFLSRPSHIPQHFSLAVLCRGRPGKIHHVLWHTWTLGGVAH